jgi:hypothetical protein
MQCIRSTNKTLEDKALSFPAFDILVDTAPCFRNTQLRIKNDTTVPPSAVLFVEEQRKFVGLVDPSHVRNEHVPTCLDCHDEDAAGSVR